MQTIYQEIHVTQALNSEMSECGVKIFNWLVDQMRSRPSIKQSVKNISIALGVCERTIQKWLSYFQQLGLIKKEQLYGIYCHNTITLNRDIFQFARYFKYRFDSLWRYLAFVYLVRRSPSEDGLRPPIKPCTPYIEEKDINNKISSLSGAVATHAHPVHPDLLVSGSGKLSYTGDGAYGLRYQESISHVSFQGEGDCPDDHRLQTFTRILEELENNLKREDMDVAPLIISPIMDKVSELFELTVHGKAKLFAFSDEVLELAVSNYKPSPSNKDPFQSFIDVCLVLCAEKNIQPDWSTYYTIMKRYNIDKKQPLYTKIVKSAAPKKYELYNAPQISIDYDQECVQWHQAVLDGKVAPGFELTYPTYLEWLHKQQPTIIQQIENLIGYKIQFDMPPTSLQEIIQETQKNPQLKELIKQLDSFDEGPPLIPDYSDNDVDYI